MLYLPPPPHSLPINPLLLPQGRISQFLNTYASLYYFPSYLIFLLVNSSASFKTLLKVWTPNSYPAIVFSFSGLFLEHAKGFTHCVSVSELHSYFYFWFPARPSCSGRIGVRWVHRGLAGNVCWVKEWTFAYNYIYIWLVSIDHTFCSQAIFQVKIASLSS